MNWESDEISKALIPPKCRAAFSNFKKVSETNYYFVYEAISLVGGQRYNIWLLNTKSSFFSQNRDRASTLFIQEVLYLSSKNPQSVVIEHCEVSVNKIAFVTKPTHNLSEKLIEESSSSIDICKMLKDLITDLNFLYSHMKLHDLSIRKEKIRFLEGQNTFFISDWSQALSIQDTDEGNDLGVQNSETTANDLYTLGLIALELKGIGAQVWNDLLETQEIIPYNSLLDNIIRRIEPDALQILLRKLLQKDVNSPQKLRSLQSQEGIWISNFKV